MEGLTAGSLGVPLAPSFPASAACSAAFPRRLGLCGERDLRGWVCGAEAVPGDAARAAPTGRQPGRCSPGCAADPAGTAVLGAAAPAVGFCGREAEPEPLAAVAPHRLLLKGSQTPLLISLLTISTSAAGGQKNKPKPTNEQNKK